jgi:hypothetical protein
MYSHHIFDGVRSLFGMVERDSRGVVMEDVVLDRAMKDMPTDKTKVSIYGRRATAKEGPGHTRIVWQLGVSML